MTALESMIKKISPFKIYNIKEDSNIYKELCCYGVALDLHRENIEKLLSEFFTATASDYGLNKRDLLYGNIMENYSLEKRREMLLTSKNINNNDFTLKGFEKCMKALGVEKYRLMEFPNLQYVVVYIYGDFTHLEKIWLEKQIKKILPAHINKYVEFESISWEDIDNNNFTFAVMDGKNYSWSEINNL